MRGLYHESSLQLQCTELIMHIQQKNYRILLELLKLSMNYPHDTAGAGSIGLILVL